MQDDLETMTAETPRIDARVLRHMMQETINLLDRSSDHAEEACQSTDAAMALTRIDWMLMEVFNWLADQLRTDGQEPEREPLGDPVSILGIDQRALSEPLLAYAQCVDRLHARVAQLETLVTATVHTQPIREIPKGGGIVLHIFGDPTPGTPMQNPVMDSRQRLKSAFGRN
jgi:hypothetical protein